MKELKEYPGYYVNEMGEVFSTSKNYSVPKKLLQEVDDRGYHRVRLQVGKYNQKKRAVHRLVAEAFIPNPLGLSDVDHKDDDPNNNKLSNLQWMSHGANCKKSRHNIGRNKATSWRILNTKTNEEFDIFNMAQWCEEHKINRSNLHKTMKKGTCGGYKVLGKIS